MDSFIVGEPSQASIIIKHAGDESVEKSPDYFSAEQMNERQSPGKPKWKTLVSALSHANLNSKTKTTNDQFVDESYLGVSGTLKMSPSRPRNLSLMKSKSPSLQSTSKLLIDADPQID